MPSAALKRAAFVVKKGKDLVGCGMITGGQGTHGPAKNCPIFYKTLIAGGIGRLYNQNSILRMAQQEKTFVDAPATKTIREASSRAVVLNRQER